MELEPADNPRNVALRIGAAVAGLLIVLLVVAAIVAPEAMMGMMHTLMHGMTGH